MAGELILITEDSEKSARLSGLLWREYSFFIELRWYKPMPGTNRSVSGTKRNTSGQAVCDKQSVKWVTGPAEPQGVADESFQRKIVNDKSSIVHDGAGELGVTDGKPANFSEKLD